MDGLANCDLLLNAIEESGLGDYKHYIGQDNNTPNVAQLNQDEPQLNSFSEGPYVRIIEQPAKLLRFRYDCDKNSSDVLYGESSTKKNMFPVVEVVGYVGPAVCEVSLVEHEVPFRVHPNDVVGKKGNFHNGLCTLANQSPDMRFAFSGANTLGIHMAKKKGKDIERKLQLRKALGVDPFEQGFDHEIRSIDTSMVRLCFQVTLKTTEYGDIKLAPVVSNVIKDSRIHAIPRIVDISDATSPMSGGRKIFIFCNKFKHSGIEVHFVQKSKGGQTLLLGQSLVSVHTPGAISILTPPCHFNERVAKPVRCKMYLYVPSTRTKSNSVDFTYTPDTETCQLPVAEQVGAISGSCRPAKSSAHAQTVTLKRLHQREEHELSSGHLAAPPKSAAPLRRCVSDQSHNSPVSHQIHASTSPSSYPTAKAQQLQTMDAIELLLTQIMTPKQTTRQDTIESETGLNRLPEDTSSSRLNELEGAFAISPQVEVLPNLHIESGDLSGSTVENITDALESGLRIIEEQNAEAPQQQQPVMQRNNLDLE